MFPKRNYVRSAKITEACRAIPCQHCGRDDGTVCAAHSNWGVHGKGGHIKADDTRVAALCATCHAELDQGKRWTAEQRKAIWWMAHLKTISSLLRLKLWPKVVPIPDTKVAPW